MFSHFLVKILPFLFMLKVGYEGLDGFHDLSLGEVVLGEDVFKLIKEGVHLFHAMTGGLLYHAQSLKT